MFVADPEGMVALGERLGRQLTAGDAVCLSGPLGAGKTTLTRGIAAGLGVTGPVASPTFVISRRYPGGAGPDLVHCDAYRLAGDDEFADVVGDPEAVVVVVEWGDDVMGAVADSWLHVSIDRRTGLGDEQRMVRFTGVGERWDDDRVAGLTRGRP